MVRSDNDLAAKFDVIVQGKIISILTIPVSASIIIGRGNDVQYQIKSGALSRHHCMISDKRNYVEVRDLGSLNGTYLNKNKISTSQIQVGDEIQIGPVTFKVKELHTLTPAPTRQKDLMEATPKQQPSFQAPETGDIHRSKTMSRGGENENELQYIKRPILENEFPSGTCESCSKDLSSKDMAAHAGVFKGNQLFCISCFSEGKGNFPTIAGYRIVKKLGGGGMGDVYEAIQLSMERPVAFKLMKGLENASEQQVMRFFREARTGGRLNHTNIVSFIDAGKLEGACFIAMEFICGIDVRQIISEQGPIHWKEAFRIAYYVAMALDYANAKFNIVHRDIKPENILIDRDNVIKLTDFGLAKNLEEAGLSGITKSQTGVGTLFYMAPEQITDARFADQRADVYSMGVSLYEMMTATRPFNAEQMMTLVNKIRYEEPTPMNAIVASIPDHVIQIVAKAMEKKPEKRFQTAKEFMPTLEPYIKDEISVGSFC